MPQLAFFAQHPAGRSGNRNMAGNTGSNSHGPVVPLQVPVPPRTPRSLSHSMPPLGRTRTSNEYHHHHHHEPSSRSADRVVHAQSPTNTLFMPLLIPSSSNREPSSSSASSALDNNQDTRIRQDAVPAYIIQPLRPLQQLPLGRSASANVAATLPHASIVKSSATARGFVEDVENRAAVLSTNLSSRLVYDSDNISISRIIVSDQGDSRTSASPFLATLIDQVAHQIEHDKASGRQCHQGTESLIARLLLLEEEASIQSGRAQAAAPISMEVALRAAIHDILTMQRKLLQAEMRQKLPDTSAVAPVTSAPEPLPSVAQGFHDDVARGTTQDLMRNDLHYCNAAVFVRDNALEHMLPPGRLWNEQVTNTSCNEAGPGLAENRPHDSDNQHRSEVKEQGYRSAEKSQLLEELDALAARVAALAQDLTMAGNLTSSSSACAIEQEQLAQAMIAVQTAEHDLHKLMTKFTALTEPSDNQELLDKADQLAYQLAAARALGDEQPKLSPLMGVGTVGTAFVSSNEAVIKSLMAEASEAMAAAKTERDDLLDKIADLTDQRSAANVLARKKHAQLLTAEARMENLESKLAETVAAKEALQLGLQKVTNSRDDLRTKLRICRETQHALKQEKESAEKRLRQGQQIQSVKHKLLLQYRKLAIHTGYHRWGKEIRGLEAELAILETVEEQQQQLPVDNRSPAAKGRNGNSNK